MNQTNPARTMTKAEAIKLLEEATSRLKHDHQNANGGSWQAGGAYWRLAKVLRCCLAPVLDEVEGKEHADFLRATHGILVKPKGVRP